MFGPRTFTVCDEVSLFDELPAENKRAFVQLDVSMRLRESGPDRTKENCNCDQKNTRSFQNDHFHCLVSGDFQLVSE